MKGAYILFGLLVLVLAVGAFFVSGERETVPTQEIVISDKQLLMANLTLTSTVFEHNNSIPPKYTCDGENKNPRLEILGVPEGTQTLALIMDDPDAPVGTWDHWIVFNIPPTTAEIPENTEPKGVGGNNSWGRTGYGGPCPPDREHRYFFKLYALDSELTLPEGATKKHVEQAMEGHILAQTELIGLYERQ